MSTRTLYIIGNGFDLWHGIASRLADFKEFVSEEDQRVADDVERYLPSREDWSDLESALADIDVEAIAEDLGHFMGSYGTDDWSDAGHGDYQYEVDNLVERLSVDLRRLFAKWVRQLPVPNHSTAPKVLHNLDTKALFFTFNYTRTLTSVYGVPSRNVLHIHGCTDLAGDELVLGHGWGPASRPSLNAGLENEDIDHRVYEANDIIDRYFASTFKRSDEIISRHALAFASLSDIQEVIVLGHSLSAVDAPYFEALLQQRSVANARWFVACREGDDWDEKLELLNALGVPIENACPSEWGNLPGSDDSRVQLAFAS